ncbi:MAG: GAF domain-containing protein [Planctomycetota bacterium]|jgi:GAF domain-containing protein
MAEGNKPTTKEKLFRKYQRLYEQLIEHLQATDNVIARMATIAAVLHNKMPLYYWTGFYIRSGDDLIVGPYQGTLACQKLEKEKGVCWACVRRKETLIVPDVEQFPGHIACDSRSRSEIAVPVFGRDGEIYSVLDVDSKERDAFNEIDREALERIVKLVYQRPRDPRTGVFRTVSRTDAARPGKSTPERPPSPPPSS